MIIRPRFRQIRTGKDAVPVSVAIDMDVSGGLMCGILFRVGISPFSVWVASILPIGMWLTVCARTEQEFVSDILLGQCATGRHGTRRWLMPSQADLSKVLWAQSEFFRFDLRAFSHSLCCKSWRHGSCWNMPGLLATRFLGWLAFRHQPSSARASTLSIAYDTGDDSGAVAIPVPER